MVRKMYIFIPAVLVLAGGVFSYEFVTGTSFLSDNYGQLFGASGKSAQKEPCLEPKPREFNREPYYTGSLIDAHLHLPTSSGIVSKVSSKMGLPTPAWSKDLSIHYLNCLFEAEEVEKAIGFHLITKYSVSGEVKVAKQMEKKYPGKVAHFLMPATMSSWIKPDIKTLKNILDKNPGLFIGIGEVKMFGEGNLDDPYFIELYELAKKYNLVVMMHPFVQHRSVVEKILKRYPNIKFLMHGGDDEEWIMDIIRDYKNVYYSLDADTTSLYGWERGHEDKNPTKEEFLAYFRANFDSIRNKELGFWKTKIENYPDKFLWGTDRWYEWHFDQEIGGLLKEYGRTFIGKLDPSVRDGFAYKNAQKLLER